jgi:hypothetical protein
MILGKWRPMTDEVSEIRRKRMHSVAEIIRLRGDRSAESMAEEILTALEQKAVLGFAYTRPNNALIINSVRETRDAVRLAGGEGDPVRVLNTAS